MANSRVYYHKLNRPNMPNNFYERLIHAPPPQIVRFDMNHMRP